MCFSREFGCTRWLGSRGVLGCVADVVGMGDGRNCWVDEWMFCVGRVDCFYTHHLLRCPPLGVNVVERISMSRLVAHRYSCEGFRRLAPFLLHSPWPSAQARSSSKTLRIPVLFAPKVGEVRGFYTQQCLGGQFFRPADLVRRIPRVDVDGPHFSFLRSYLSSPPASFSDKNVVWLMAFFVTVSVLYK